MHKEKAMQRTVLFLGLGVLILLAGCTAGQTPEAHFAALKAKQATSTYHVTYDLSSGALSGGDADLLSEASIDTYARAARSKTVVQISVFGQTMTIAEFQDGNNTVTCREGGLSDGLTCSVGGSTRFDLTDEYTQPEKFHLNRSGTRTVAGRQCQMFTARPNSSDIDTGGVDPEKTLIEICLDTGKGYLALLRINATESSRLAEDTARNVLTLRATNHDDTVTESDVTPPIPFTVDAGCAAGRVSITPLRDIARATVEVGETNTTTELGPIYTPTTVEVPAESLRAAGRVTIYTTEGSRTATCGTGSFFDQFR